MNENIPGPLNCRVDLRNRKGVSIRRAKPRGKKEDVEALRQLLEIKSLMFFVSEDVASEVKKKPPSFWKGLVKVLDSFNFTSLQHRIRYGDKYHYRHGVTFGGPYPEIKDQIRSFLEEMSGVSNKSEHEYDARELANCYKNKMDYFMTIDERTILRYKDKIKEKFGIKAITPTRLLEKLTSNY